jgi:drug/metabolite transporter (DMT)-like permease
MPVVALFLGVGLLGEKLSAGAAAGLILIAAGDWLATGRQPAREQISAGTDDPLAEGNDT